MLATTVSGAAMRILRLLFGLVVFLILAVGAIIFFLPGEQIARLASDQVKEQFGNFGRRPAELLSDAWDFDRACYALKRGVVCEWADVPSRRGHHWRGRHGADRGRNTH